MDVGILFFPSLNYELVRAVLEFSLHGTFPRRLVILDTGTVTFSSRIFHFAGLVSPLSYLWVLWDESGPQIYIFTDVILDTILRAFGALWIKCSCVFRFLFPCTLLEQMFDSDSGRLGGICACRRPLEQRFCCSERVLKITGFLRG